MSAMRKEAAVPAELATTTFGPLDKYVPANDNARPVTHTAPGTTQDTAGNVYRSPVDESGASSGFGVGAERGQYIGLRRGGYDVPAEHQPLVAEMCRIAKEQFRGPFIQVYPARKFYPFDPRPEEVFIESIAHHLSNICRYSGAGDKHFSVAEHSTLIARYLAARHAPEVAIAGLLHDAPEALSGFGDVGRPVKGRAPIIGETEDGIYRRAIAPRFGLPLDIPAEVHEADSRIIADEIAANLAPMDWQARHDNPLGVNIRCWSPEKAEIEFLATFDALTGGVGRRAG